MAIQILSSPPPEPEAIVPQLEEAIRGAFPDAEIQVQAGSPGHFMIEVVDASFENLTRVKQQQGVYAAIQHLMAGDQAPVHAVDRLITRAS